MTTYSDESNGRARTSAAPRGDVTTWHYDELSGCMTNKVYADGKGPTYSYTPDGKFARRTCGARDGLTLWRECMMAN